jgi:hypothetical protein
MTVEHRMVDRLQELLQQRALIKEHLAWLEGEISAAAGRPAEVREAAPIFPASPSALRPAAVTQPPTPLSAPAAPARTAQRKQEDADAMIARLAAEETSAPVPAKKGCWIFFCATLVVLGAAAWAALHYFYRG